jgi:hypothetical protein
MKKLLLLLVIGVVITSCEKVHVCECEQEFSISGQVEYHTHETQIKDTKSNAKELCEFQGPQNSWTTQTGDYNTVVCKLK